MSCEISVIYPGLEGAELVLEIPEARRSFGVINFGSDPSVCFGTAPGMGGFVLDRWEAEEYGILPRHCALLWAGGKFRLEFDRHAGVYLNGSDTCARSFCNPFEDGPEFEMRLGLPGTDKSGTELGIAPVFRVRRKDHVRQKSSLLTRLALRWRWFRKVAMVPFLVSLPALVVGVALLAAGFLGWNLWQGQRITEALIRADIPETISRKYVPSVASIGVETERGFRPLGTAWLYEHRKSSGESSFWLITNQHVAQQMQVAACPGGPQSSSAVARFPRSADGTVSAETLKLPSCAFVHPLFSAFETYRSSHAAQGGAADGGGAAINGQQAVANLYDLAAFRIDRSDLDPSREFLRLRAPVTGTISAFDSDAAFTQNLQPGRPVLILSYPTENQPFLADGVSAEPFEFRTRLQSKFNAMSRSIPGNSSNRTPALYSFSARSAGGISGSPVITLDEDGAPFVSAIVFAASFVRGDATSASGASRRLATGDGTYALDATSLSTIEDWGTVPSWQVAERAAKVREVWDTWASDLSPLDENRILFAEANAQVTNELGGPALKVCETSRMLDLTNRLEDEMDPRGEYPRPVRLHLSDSAQNTLIVADSRIRGDAEALIQMMIHEWRRGIKFTNHERGLNQASYLIEKNAGANIEIGIAGPYRSRVTLTVYEAIPQAQDCPTRKGWK